MPKIQFSDVTPPEKRSIRNIPIPNGGKRKSPVIKPAARPAEPEREYEEITVKKPVSNFNSNVSSPIQNNGSNSYEYYYQREEKPMKSSVRTGGGKKKLVFGTITLLVIAGFIFGMMTVFASATISITPKSQSINVDTKITASPDGNGAVRYEITKLTESKTVSVPATGEESVELQASGKIVIYNNFSSDPQRLITRTRFETPEGLIYRIQDSVMVPGKTAAGPGSIEATVVADEAGDKYNIKKTDFTIPGFKNDAARYKGFYGRSSAEMTGGFIGKRKTVSESDKQTAMQSIDSEVQNSLQKELAGKVPEGLVILPGAISYDSKELQPKESSSSVDIGKEITAYAVLFDKQSLSDAITERYMASSTDWNNIKPVIKDFSPLSISGLPSNLTNSGNLSLNIKGTAKVLADIDINLINQKLLGVPKTTVGKLMDEFPGIQNLSATIRPVWKQVFPTNSSKIHVETITN